MITDDDIRRAVSHNAFNAGLEYFFESRVRDLRTLSDGTVIQARVTGSGRSTYKQVIQLMRDPGGRLIPSGSCTCPVGLDCKHVAAVLFEAQERADLPPHAVAIGPTRDRLRRESQPTRPHAGQAPAQVQTLARPAAATPLPADVDAWLRRLAAAQQEETEDYPPTVRKRLLFVLDRGPFFGGLVVRTQSIELRRDGTTIPTPTDHLPDQLLRTGQQPQFLRPSDRAILRQLVGMNIEENEAFVAVLQAIIATGRGRWARWDGPTLTVGPAVPGEFDWRLSEDGSQRAALVLAAPLVALRLVSPWYVDPGNGTVGPIETALPSRLLHALLAGPDLPSAIADRVRDEMDRRWPGHSLPPPKQLAPPQRLQEALQPHLLLLSGELPFDPATVTAADRYRPAYQVGSFRVPVARLLWRYGPVSLSAGTAFQRERVTQRDGVLFTLIRDGAGEARAAEIARTLGLEPVAQFQVMADTHPHARDMTMIGPDRTAWIEFVLDDVPRLRERGWLVDVADDFPLRLVEPTGDISFEITGGSGIDWFDVELGVALEGERVSLVPALLDFIATGGGEALAGIGTDAREQALPLLLPLPDGRLLAVPLDRLRPILAPLLELFADAEVDERAGTLRLSMRDAADLAALEEAGAGRGIAWTGGDAIRALGRQLRDGGGIPPCAAPPGFRADLRAYQAHGLAWLQFLRGAGLGGVLADDMGLGKTVQALAHLAVEQAAGRTDLPSLVVCPTSLVANWLAEATRFAPGLRCLVLHGPERAGRFAAIATHDLVVTTYPLLARDHEVLGAQEWHVVVLDEAQTIKNPLAATSRLARTLRARQRLCLSGTPLENHLGELWSLFDFLLPGFLGDRKQFGARYRGPIEKAGNTERQALLARRVAPFLLRRTKEQVAADLPPKTEITETVELEERQRALYEAIRLAMHTKVRAAVAKRGLAGSGIVILDALLKLRQVCNDPRLLKLPAARASNAKSAKLERLLELLPQMLDEGRRILLFSQFTSMLALLETELARLAIPSVLLTGDTRDRAGPIDRFQSGGVPLFLISLKAGGVGLNLTAADTVIHYDPWWNPAVENQATDRAHRIGQQKPVFVHRLITAGTIEEKMAALKGRKQALADGILRGDAGATLALTEGDLDMLFAPAGR